jgi:predicted  nucleic acid-binding Zn-ribbon protein
MPPEISPEQNAQLASWAAQRDAILTEISGLKTEKEGLTKTNLDLAAANTDLEQRALIIEGRIQELDKKEKEQEGIVSVEIADLTAQKTGLQSDVSNLRGEIVVLQTQKNMIKDTINTLSDVHDRVFARAEGIDHTVDHLSMVNKSNLREIEMLLSSLKVGVQGIIDASTANVEKTNFVINELPRVFFDLHRRLPVHSNKAIRVMANHADDNATPA